MAINGLRLLSLLILHSWKKLNCFSVFISASFPLFWNFIFNIPLFFFINLCTCLKCAKIFSPNWKNNSDQSPRDWHLSASLEPNWGLPWNPSDHHSSIVLRSLRGVLYLSPIMQRDASLSDSTCIFFQFGISRNNYETLGPNWEKLHLLSERFAFHGRMGDQLKTFLKSLNTVVLWWSERF